MTKIYSTEVGRRVASSGLRPETANFLLAYLVSKQGDMIRLLPDETGSGGDVDALNFCLICASLMSPEFSGLDRTRFIHFGFDATVANPVANQLASLLAEQPWQAYRSAVNASSLMLEWISGATFSQLENRFQAVRAGTVEGLCREVVWCLSGLADVVAFATRLDIDFIERPSCLRDAASQTLRDVRRLIPSLRLLAWRLSTGLPDTVLWLSEAREDTGQPLITRREAVALNSQGLGNYVAIRQRSNWNVVVNALQQANIQNAHERAQVIQQFADNWHTRLRERVKTRLIKRVGTAHVELVNHYFESRGTEFERAFEELLTFSGIRFTRFDVPPKKAAFDYLLHIDERPDFPLECKSKQGHSIVPLNEVTDVLRATELHGYSGANCATLCQPIVDPNVSAEIRSCVRLCVVEAHVLGEALVQVAHHRASAKDLYDWLSQPGVASLETFLPREHVALGVSNSDTPSSS